MRTTLRQRLYLALFLIFCLSPFCPLKAQSGTSGKTIQSGQSEQEPNGISVGRPKVFDNRTLTIMLESLSESLRNVQTQFINKEALAAAFSFLQGTRTSETVSNFSLTGLPVPSLKQESITNTGNVTTSGTPLPDTTKVTTTSERPSVTPQAPGLDTFGGFPTGFNPSFGSNPSDLLSDQVNLTYQIFNLRMLLERSLSDRLLDDNQTRRQAVLGFNVTIDPPRTANDAVAVVEIKLKVPYDKCTDKPDDCLSLVSLMPQEKTYNSAALSTKSHAFGGAAVVNMLQVGFSERHRGQVFYLYRDNDTISYERMNSDHPNEIIFGWMFRPVLGRRSVSPGLRQLFAIVALPSEDTTQVYRERRDKRSSELSTAHLNAEVITYWKKYDSNTMTSFKESDTNRAGRFRNGVLFGLMKPEIFANRYTNWARYDDIEVKPTEKYQEGLQPKLDQLKWKLIGQKSVVISAQGNNFFTGTQVSIGDKTYASPADGLVLKSNQAFDLSVGLDAIISGTGSISGRYGSAIPLVAKDTPLWGITINRATAEPSFAGYRLLKIELQEYLTGTSPFFPVIKPFDFFSDLPLEKYGMPVITVNGNFVYPPYDLDPSSGFIQANVPESFLSKGGGMIKVSYPFLPDNNWTATYVLPDPTASFQITRLNSKSILLFTKNRGGFTHDLANPLNFPQSTDYCWKLIAGNGEPIPLRTDYCKERQPTPNSPDTQQAGGRRRRGTRRRDTKKPAATAASSNVPTIVVVSDNALTVTLGSDIPDKIVLVSPLGAISSLEVPKLVQPPPAPPKPIELNQNDSVWIDIAVDDVSKVGAVEANQISLRKRNPPPDADGNPPKTIQVQITRDITAKPGNVEITVLDTDGKPLLDKDGKPVTAHVHISAADDKGEKQ